MSSPQEQYAGVVALQTLKSTIHAKQLNLIVELSMAGCDEDYFSTMGKISLAKELLEYLDVEISCRLDQISYCGDEHDWN